MISESVDRTADDKLTRLLTHDLFYVYGFKHEVFSVLKDAYPQASLRVRQEIVTAIGRWLRFPHLERIQSARLVKVGSGRRLHRSDPQCRPGPNRAYRARAVFPDGRPRVRVRQASSRPQPAPSPVLHHPSARGTLLQPPSMHPARRSGSR
jgi:hypothetical protein